MAVKRPTPQRRLEVAYIDGFSITRLAGARWAESAKVGLSEGHFTFADTRAAFRAVNTLFKNNPAWITDSAAIDTVKLADACAAVDGAEAGTLIKDRAANAVNYAGTVKRLKDAHDKQRITDGLKGALIGVENSEDAGTALLLARETLDRLAGEVKPDAGTVSASTPTVWLADLPDPAPEADNPAALFRGGWLRKGGGAFLIAPSGQGKSTWTIQAAICWAMGKAAFGIEPLRPLNIAIVQAEDDSEEMAFFRNQIGRGLETEAGLDPVQIGAAMSKGVMLCDMTGAAGTAFIDRLANLLKTHPEIDLLIINPFQSYFGGDVSHNAELTEFLRVGLDPLIKPGRVGVLFVHHTNKPPSAKDRNGWGTDAFSAYIGAGGAELTNWARAMLALMPVENMPGVFRLVAGKRGQRLGWVDAAGVKTCTRLIAHMDGLVFWRNATDEEAEAVQGAGVAGSKRGDPEADAGTLATQAQSKAWKLTDLRKYAMDYFGSGQGRRAFVFLRDNAADFKLALVPAKWKGTTFIGTRPEAEEAAREWDIAKPKGKQ